MKKMVILGLFLAILVSGLSLSGVAMAGNNKWFDRPLCYFWLLGTQCGKDSDNNYSPSNPAPISDTPVINPNPNPIVSGTSDVNDAPAWAGFQTTYSAKVGQLLEFTISAVDPDGDNLIYAAHFLPAGASFNINTRTLSWTPSNSQTGSHALQFSVSDRQYILYQTITVNVGGDSANNNNTNTNRWPVWNYVPDQRVNINQLVLFSIFASDSDGDYLNYSAQNLPFGAVFNSYSRTFSWVPNQNQVGTYMVTFRVSDGYHVSDMNTAIIVSVPYVYVPTPTPTPAPASVYNPPASPAANSKPIVTTTVQEEELRIFDIQIESDHQDVLISWKTNIPARDRVIYDTVSQAEKTRNFTYANVTPDSDGFSTRHSVRLNNLRNETMYYLRAVAKTSDQTKISNEIAFVKLPTGQVNAFFGASVFGVLGSLLASTEFLVLIIIGLSAALIVLYQKYRKASVL